MKRTHLVLLIVTAITALFSAYSLAAINQTFNINYEWYSELNSKYVDEYRETNRDRWVEQNYSEYIQFKIVGSNKEFDLANKPESLNKMVSETDFAHYIFLYCTLSNVYSPEYRIRVVDIAQRGSTVEVKVSLNSPEKLPDEKSSLWSISQLTDIVRIKRSAFASKGKLLFIFKDQYGKQLFNIYYDI